MARALLIALALLAPSSALAQSGDNAGGQRVLPPEFLGILLRVSGAMPVGEGADKLASPLFGYGGSLQMRIVEGLYLDVSVDSYLPVSGDAPADGFLIGIDQQFAGLRLRQPVGPDFRVVLGAGGGGVTMSEIDAEGARAKGAGAAAYGMLGFEREVTSTAGSTSNVGFEVSYHHYFPDEDAPLKGGTVAGRVTFSYYFGGDDAADCCL